MKQICLILLTCFLFLACSSPKPLLPSEKLYIWDGYLQSSLALGTNPSKTQLASHLRVLLNIIAQSDKAHKRVAPGIYAGVGQLYYDLGEQEKGIKYFLLEKSTYPEAKVFIDNALKELYPTQFGSQDKQAKNAKEEILTNNTKEEKK